MAAQAQGNAADWDVAELDLTLVGNLGASVAPVMEEAAETTGAPGAPVVLFADVRLPAQFAPRQMQVLSVQLRLQPAAESRTQETVPVTFAPGSGGDPPPPEYVEVRLVAPGFREQTGIWERTLTVYPSRDSQPAVFSLTGEDQGRKRLAVDFYHKGRMIASLALASEVKEGSTGAEQPADLPPNPPPPADLELRVTRTVDGLLAFVLNSPLPELALQAQPVGQVKLPSPDPQTFFNDRLQRLDDLARMLSAVGPDQQRLAQEVEAIGEALFEQFFPPELQQIYWERIQPLVEKGAIRTLLINSDEPWVPWELLKPYRWNDTGDREQTAPFLAEQFAISRWLPRPLPPGPLVVKQAVLVMPDLNLVYAQEERAALEQLAQARQVQLQGPLQRRDEVIDSLRAGGFQLLHIATHSRFDTEDANHSELQLDDGSLTPADLAGSGLRGLRRDRPLIFLNTDESGRVALTPSDLGGWAHKFFVEGRASAFVGTQWPVSDELAAAFAGVFYVRLVEGYPLAEAVRAARLHIRDQEPGNPTWLNYAVYGDPNLVVIFGDEPPPEAIETVDAVDWYVAWAETPAGELAIGQSYTLALRFLQSGDAPGAVPLRLPVTAQALTVFVDGTPELQLESQPRLYAPVQAGQLQQTHFPIQVRPVLPGAAALSAEVFAGREIEGAPPVALPPLALPIAAPVGLPDIREILDLRLVPQPQPDVLLYVALEALPPGAGAPDGVQLRPYLSGPITGGAVVRLAPLPLSLADVDALGAAAAAAAQETQHDLGGSDPVALRRLGMALYDLLMPPPDEQAAPSALDLRTVYWRLAALARRTGRTPAWLIIADPHAVLPWELVRPYAEDGKEEDFLAAQFLVSHWIGRRQLRLERLAPVRKLELVHYDQDAGDLAPWELSLGGPQWVEIPAGGDLRLTQTGAEVMGLHLLRFVERSGPGRIVSAQPEGAAGGPSGDQRVVAAAAQRRLDFAARHPIVGLSWVDAQMETCGWAPAPVGAAPVDAWALSLLRAEASAVVGPRWPTAVASDRRFYSVFYAAIRAGRRLGAAVHAARLAVRAAAPQSGDWLAYAWYGHPACEPYQVVRAEAFAVCEITNYPDDKPLVHGQPYTFRAAYRALAPQNFQGRVYLEQPLPALTDPKVMVDASFLDEALPVPLSRASDLAYEALFTLQMPEQGDTARVAVYFQDGGTRLQVLNFYLDLVPDEARQLAAEGSV